MKSVWVGCLVPALLLGMPALASAHGAVRGSSPTAGSEVAKAPKTVSVTLAEPPSKGSTLVVTDGCERKVSGGGPLIQDDALETAIEGGEPGRWAVEVRSISAADGHDVKEAFTFNVSGKKDCSPAKPKGKPSPDDSPDTSSRPPIDNPDGPTSFPVVPFALGTLAVVAVAVAVRRPWNKS